MPEPVAGHMLIDTGASSTCISQQAAEALALKPSGVGQSHGAHGLRPVLQYVARLYISFEHEGGTFQTVREGQVMAVPDLEKAMPPTLLAGGTPVKLVGLLGRDFLRYVTFHYHGDEGRFMIRVHADSLVRPSKKPQ